MIVVKFEKLLSNIFLYVRCKISRTFQLFLCSDNSEVILELTALSIQFVTNILVLLMDFEFFVTCINDSHLQSAKNLNSFPVWS